MTTNRGASPNTADSPDTADTPDAFDAADTAHATDTADTADAGEPGHAGSLLSVRDLSTHFVTRAETVKAVRGVSFEVGAEESVGIVGETGSGKSVTLRSILGLLEPAGRVVSGDVFFDGMDLRRIGTSRLRELRGRRIGFVPQNPFGSLNPILGIETQFRNVLRAHGVRASRTEMRARFVSMLESVGIGEPDRVLDGYAHQLSGGMAQRVVIAMAFMLEPDLIIADEPTTALDVTVQKQILDLLADLITKGRRSLLIVTHDLGVVAHYCDRVIVMYQGEVVESGPVRQVFTNPSQQYSRALLAAIPKPGQRW